MGKLERTTERVTIDNKLKDLHTVGVLIEKHYKALCLLMLKGDSLPATVWSHYKFWYLPRNTAYAECRELGYKWDTEIRAWRVVPTAETES